MTPEQKLEEKLRRQKLQEESDLRLAMETFGMYTWTLQHNTRNSLIIIM